MDLKNRVSRERISIETPADGPWSVDGDEPAAARAALFLVSRCGARLTAPRRRAEQATHARPKRPSDPRWDHDASGLRARR
jgi:hypothetical protein